MGNFPIDFITRLFSNVFSKTAFISGCGNKELEVSQRYVRHRPQQQGDEEFSERELILRKSDQWLDHYDIADVAFCAPEWVYDWGLDRSVRNCTWVRYTEAQYPTEFGIINSKVDKSCGSDKGILALERGACKKDYSPRSTKDSYYCIMDTLVKQGDQIVQQMSAADPVARISLKRDLLIRVMIPLRVLMERVEGNVSLGNLVNMISRARAGFQAQLSSTQH